MKTVLFKQPCGLGDILFCQKIVHYLSINDGFERSIWPVSRAYDYIGEYIINGLETEFPCVDDDFPYKKYYNSCKNSSILINNEEDVEIIGIDGCNGPMGVMHEKYNLIKNQLGIEADCTNWQDYFRIKRNPRKEYDLYKRLNPNDEPFVLINKHIGTPPNHLSYWDHIDTNTTLKKIYVEFIPKYTIFDWCLLIELANEIHMEGSALTYIIEHLNIRASKLKLYSRNHDAIKEIFKTPWTKA